MVIWNDVFCAPIHIRPGSYIGQTEGAILLASIFQESLYYFPGTGKFDVYTSCSGDLCRTVPWPDCSGAVQWLLQSTAVRLWWISLSGGCLATVTSLDTPSLSISVLHYWHWQSMQLLRLPAVGLHNHLLPVLCSSVWGKNGKSL